MDSASLADAVEMADAAPSSGFYLFFAAVVAAMASSRSLPHGYATLFFWVETQRHPGLLRSAFFVLKSI